MALQKTIPTPYGNDNSYWRVTNISIDTDSASVSLSVSGYIDEDAFTAGKLAQSFRSYGLSGPDADPFFVTGGVPLDLAYDALLDTPDFSGADLV